jgi:UDP-N-acetylglucosamine--N-acetylmuramyl-(pentapeptide) pyrophosphoryl-undecaprenol N-acetylglucosamine transferase
MSRPDTTTRIVIAGGGTGGHLFPGLALGEKLRQHGAQVTFVGTARGIEAKVIPQAGYPLSN